jgi:hypothetical protein
VLSRRATLAQCLLHREIGRERKALNVEGACKHFADLVVVRDVRRPIVNHIERYNLGRVIQAELLNLRKHFCKARGRTANAVGATDATDGLRNRDIKNTHTIRKLVTGSKCLTAKPIQRDPRKPIRHRPNTTIERARIVTPR